MKLIIKLVMICFPAFSFADWKVDFSRRQKDLQRLEMERKAANAEDKSVVEQVFEKEQPKEQVVIINTEKGFVPEVVRLKKGQLYQVSVVNVNKNKKNVSFMLDAFSEHHGTYFGDVISFVIRPQQEGLFPFVSPEVEFVGKVLVYGEDDKLEPIPPIKIRQPAEEQKDVKHNFVRGGHGPI